MEKFIFLIADDDDDDRQLFCEALENVDPQVECYCACDGEDVFRVLKNQRQPDVIFLDINMPVMDGWQCLQLLRKDDRYKNTLIFIYSTSNLVFDMNKALELGATAFITKPSSFKKIESTLRNILEAIHVGRINAPLEIEGVITKKSSVSA
jgi:CheY-like chemotaxis protein